VLRRVLAPGTIQWLVDMLITDFTQVFITPAFKRRLDANEGYYGNIVFRGLGKDTAIVQLVHALNLFRQPRFRILDTAGNTFQD